MINVLKIRDTFFCDFLKILMIIID